MPNYTYKCSKCGKIDNYVLPMDHDPPEHCGVMMNRQWSEMNFILKGEGWAKQGYQKPNQYEMENNWTSISKK